MTDMTTNDELAKRIRETDAMRFSHYESRLVRHSQETTEARAAFPDLVDENKRLREIVERLPKTLDGVPIVPGIDVWCETSDSPVAVKMYGELQLSIPQTIYYLRGCWSTHELAMKSREASLNAGKEGTDGK